jgi:hypothetical protein
VWADDIRKKNRTYHAWHYVTLKFQNTDDPMPTRADFPESQHVSWAIEHEKSILKNPQKSEAEKALALRLLLHWVGDIHQPLHAAAHVAERYPNGDSGGHGFKLAGKRDLNNLHKLWDSGLKQWDSDMKRPLSAEDQMDLTMQAKALLKKAPVELGSMDPYDWALESHALARDYVYTDVSYKKLPSKNYLERGAELSREQVTLAGLRLGVILNEVLGKQ